MADWQAIKTEYITTDTSYRKLAEKYGITHVQISRVGKAEGWVELRKQYVSKTLAKTLEKTSERQARKAARINDVADKLLAKLEKAVEELDLQITTRKIKVENGNTEETMEFKVATEGGIVDRAGLRQLTAALKDLKEIKGELSELDREEQEARIANLRRQADKGEDAVSELEVVFAAGPEEWNE